MRLWTRSLVWLIALACATASLRVHAQDTVAIVPPYPGPAPTSWPSVDQYEQYAQERAAQLEGRRKALWLAGRPPHYQLKRGSLLSLLAIGTVVAVSGFIVLWTRSSDQERAHSNISHVAFGSMLAGAGVALAGGFGARAIKARNKHGEEVEQLRRERDYWSHEVERVEHERARGSYELSLRGLGLQVAF